MKIKINPRNWNRSAFGAAIFCSIILSSVASAQLMGTKNIPGDYVTLAAAITDLNTQGVGAGGVTLNLIAGNPETAPAGGYVIGDTGSLVLTTTSASSPVIIQGNANIITASGTQTVGNLNDAIFKLIGADWVTITGFVMQENAANTVTAAASNNMTEWGVALLYVTTTDGAQNDTVSNNTITLNRTYQNTFGIYSNSTHSATSVTTSATATGAAGGNGGLKIYTNNISNVNQGITVVGPTAAVDNNDLLDIGGAAAATGNSITDYGTTGTFSGYANVSGTVNGILVRNTRNYNVSYNLVNSSNGGTTVGTLRGIYVPAFSNAPTGTFADTINHNSVSVRSGLIAGAINGIMVEAATNSATSTLNIDNNDFNTITHTVAGTGTITVLQNASTALTQSISNNTFTNLAPNTAGSVTLINNTNSIATATGTKNVNNNSIVTGFNKTGSGGSVTMFTDTGIDVAGVTSNFSNNTFSNITVAGNTGILAINHSNGSGPFTGPNRTISGNTISSITAGTGTVTALNENGDNGTTNVFNNTVSGITNANLITALATGTTGTGTVNIYQNNINSLTSTGAGAVTGLQIQGGVGSTKNIHHNKVCNLENSSATGTVVGVSVSSAGTTTNLYNNLIGDLRTPTASAVNPLIGINLNTNTVISSVNVSYNTVYLNATSSGTNFGSSGLSVLTSTAPTTATLNLRNNAIVNLSTANGTGKTAAYRRSSAVLTNYGSASNNNDFYAGAPGAANVIFFDGTNSDQTLAAYQTRVATRDSASVTENPPFLNTTCGNANFLHLDMTVATQLESAGANVSGITDDFDGNIRQGNPGYVGSGTAPDIGADEIAGIPMDVTPAVITYTPLANTASVANRTLATTITDGSGVPTAGAGLPVLYYRKGMAGAFTAAQATSGGGSSYTFTIDSGMLGGVIIGDTIQYYVVAQDTAATPNVGANPSAGAGAFTTNPPAAGTPPTTPSSYTILASASGTFNVGASQPAPYNTLTAAIADLNSKGLTGPATFVLTDATYSGSETFPIVIAPNGDSSSNNTITIKPAKGQAVAINGSSTTGIIRINGADYVTIEGSNGGMMTTEEGDLPTRDLTITNSNAAGVCVWITSFSANDGANNSTVQNCNLSGGPGVVALAGVLSGSGVTLGNDAEFPNNNILVQNNNIFRVQNSCDLRGTTLAADTGWVVTGNTCGSTVAADKNTVRGIRVGNCQGFLISGNTVNGVVSTPASTTKVAGIQTNLVINGGTITQNKIRDIKQLNPGQAVAAIGIDLAGGNNIVVTNNFVSDINHDMTGGFNNGPNSGVVGIDITSGTGHQVYYNSVNLYGSMLGTPTPPIVSAAFAINAQTSIGCIVRDNIFANNMTGGAAPNVRHVAVFLPSPATANMNLTENNNAYYYGTDATTQGVGQGGNTAGTFLTTLASFQAYSMPLSTVGTNDNASVAFNTAVPFMASDDLHITCASAVDNAGVPIAEITTDIDGNMRSVATPDLGADETHAPTAISAVSRKTHGAAGDFDTALPSSGPIGIECRSGGATNDYKIVVTFASPVTLGSAALTTGTGSVAMATVGKNKITIDLTGVTNGQYITVGLHCVSDGVNSGDMTVNMGVLAGDSAGIGNGNVGASDIAFVKSQSGQTVDATNFRADVAVNGSIGASDIALVKSQSGTFLP